MKKTQKKALAVGAGIAGLAAAAAGVYMLTGKNAKNRKKLGKWVNNMQDEIVDELNKAGKITKSTYHKVIDTAAKNYKGLKNVSAGELALVAAELKSNWDTISAELQAASKSVQRAAPKTARKIAKRVMGGGAKKTAKAPAKKTAKKAPAKKTAKRK